jgi:D-3-phosphoglycerate dehydrogenase
VSGRILITCRQMQVSVPHVEARMRAAGVQWDCPPIPGQQFAAEDLVPIIGAYDAIIAGDDEISRKVLEAGLPKLKIVAKWGIGVDGIDQVAAAELGIAVANTPGMFDDEVADVALGYLLSLMRGLHEIDREVRAGGWLKIEGRSPRGKTLGIVGLGGTGRAMAVRGQAVGMTVVGCDPSPVCADLAREAGVEVVPFDEVVRRSQVLSLHCPLTPETTGLISAQVLAAMPDGSFLVNTSRGRVVQEAAVVEALRTGKLAGAALDVFEVEPLPAGSPLRQIPNTILGSHNGSNSREAVLRTSERALENALIGMGLA